MPPSDSYQSPIQLSNGPFLSNADTQKPTPAHLTPSHAFPHKEPHLTPSHAFPPTADSKIIDPEHARASLSKTDSTDSEEHHHHAEKEYESCASCYAQGKEPFQGHTDRDEGCTCVIGEGAVPTEIHRGNAGSGGSQHGMSFSLHRLP